LRNENACMVRFWEAMRAFSFFNSIKYFRDESLGRMKMKYSERERKLKKAGWPLRKSLFKVSLFSIFAAREKDTLATLLGISSKRSSPFWRVRKSGLSFR